MNQRQHLPQLQRRDWLRLSLGAPALAFLGGCGTLGRSREELSGKITIVGATSTQPLLAAAAQNFERAHAGVQIQLRTTGSISGLDAMAQRQADITLSDTYADLALYPDPDMTDYQLLCIVCFAMIVHPRLSISTLTQQQLIDIYSTSTIRNWKEVGGPDLPITPVVRVPASGTRDVFRKRVLGGRDESAQSTGTLVQKNFSLDVRDYVAHQRGAIGYLAMPLADRTVKTLSLEGQTPTAENIRNGTYPFWSYEHVYTVNGTNPLVAAFLDFLSGSEVQDLVSQFHYQPSESIRLKLDGLPTTRHGASWARPTERP